MNEIDTLIRATSSSLAITWHTDAPFKIGRVETERIGFAYLPCVVVTVYCRDADISALVPIVRQRVYGELAERGWRPEDVAVTPSVRADRRRKFTDTNERSESYGREKFGTEHRFSFDMGSELTKATFQGSGSFKPIPRREP